MRIPVVSREIGRISQYLEAEVGQSSNEIVDAQLENSTLTSESTNDTEEQDVDIDLEQTNSDTLWSTPPQDSWNTNCSFTHYGKTRCVSPYGNVRRRSWNASEQSTAIDIFSGQIELKTIPSLAECATVIKSTKELGSRTPTQLKAWVANQIQKERRPNTKIEKNRVYWTSEEKNAMREIFTKNLGDGILPGLKLCEEVRQQLSVLRSRTAKTMKAWINNELKRIKKMKK